MSISFDQAADYYDQTRGYKDDTAYRIRDAILQTVKATPATRFLEVGIGTGRIGFPFIQAGYNYTGIDISPAMLAKLQEKISKDSQVQSDKVSLMVGDITNLPFPDNSFEVALSVHVFHLVSEWQKAIDQIRRVLVKPGGILLVGYDDAGGEETPLGTVRRVWNDIVRELGGGEYMETPGDWRGEKIVAYLKEIGAQVEPVELVPIDRGAETFRSNVERLASRKYSSQWRVPDDIFKASIEKLQNWLEAEIPNPDEEIVISAKFRANLARF
jgi:ubiquinone/menaquinone biosynthesis C-methylase UbiE